MQVGEASRRALQRLSLFAGIVPADAVVALALVDRSELARLIDSGELAPTTGGFRIADEARALVAALPADAKDAREDAMLHAEWLLRAFASMQTAVDTNVVFDLMEPMLADARAAIARLSRAEKEDARAAELAARLWCAIADLLFYRRALSFDVPEYAAAVEWADRSADAELRIATRIFAGRAAMEVRPTGARSWFETARDLAREAGLRDLEADAVRGLGWFFMAEGEVATARQLFDAARATHEQADVRNMRGVADACMAQGVAAALSGELPSSEALFFRAEAVLRARQDSVRLAKLENLRAMFGFGGQQPWADIPVDDWLSRGQYWRAAIALARGGDEKGQARARILAELAGIPWEKIVDEAPPASAPPDDAQPSTTAPRWILRAIGPRRILVMPDGRELDVTRRGPLVRMIEVLGRTRAPVAPADLFAAAWPGESVRHESALYRVYTTVRRLRALGLPIATTAEGYYCEPLSTAG